MENKIIRFIFAALSAATAWFIYIKLSSYLIEADQYTALLAEQTGGLVSITDLGNFETMRLYLVAMGWLVVGVNFAHGFAPDGSAPKAIWKLVKTLIKIAFWALFIYTEFNLIGIRGDFSIFVINLNINIKIFFYAMMGGNIFQLILTIFDFLIAFIPEKADKKTIQVAKSTSYSPALEEGL